MASYLAEMHGRNITPWQGQVELPGLKKRVDCMGQACCFDPEF